MKANKERTILFIGGAILVLIGLSGSLWANANKPPTTTTTTTIEAKLTPPGDVILGSGSSCMRLGDAYSDPTMYNLKWDGYDVDFRNGVWYFNGSPIAVAEAEDEAFTACAIPSVIDTMFQYQSDAIAAGAKPVYEE